MKTINEHRGGRVLCMALLAAGLTCAPGCGKKAAPQVFDTEVDNDLMTFLCKYQSAQQMARIDMQGRYGSLKDLISRELVDSTLAGAVDSGQKPDAFRGYLLADINSDENGDSLDRRQRSGICAYPADAGREPGRKSKKPVILVLADEKDPEEFGFYVTAPVAWKTLKFPLRQWPSQTALDENFFRIEKKVSAGVDGQELKTDDRGLPTL